MSTGRSGDQTRASGPAERTDTSLPPRARGRTTVLGWRNSGETSAAVPVYYMKCKGIVPLVRKRRSQRGEYTLGEGRKRRTSGRPLSQGQRSPLRPRCHSRAGFDPESSTPRLRWTAYPDCHLLYRPSTTTLSNVLQIIIIKNRCRNTTGTTIRDPTSFPFTFMS